MELLFKHLEVGGAAFGAGIGRTLDSKNNIGENT